MSLALVPSAVVWLLAWRTTGPSEGPEIVAIVVLGGISAIALAIVARHALGLPAGPERRAMLLVFGGARLPKLARSLGQAQKEFKEGLSEESDDDNNA